MAMENIIWWLLLIWIGLTIYLLPTIIAYNRDYHNKTTVMWVNILLSWMPLVWFICLIYSFGKTKQDKEREEAVYNFITNNK